MVQVSYSENQDKEFESMTKNLVIRKKKTVALTHDEAIKMGLREKPFNFWVPIQNDAGNCLTVTHCLQLLDIQQDDSTTKSRALGIIWNRIISGGKYREANEETLALIEFLNAMRFLKIGNKYVAIIPREIPKESLSYEVSLLIKFGINLARIQRFKTSKPEWIDIYIKANRKIIQQLKNVHYQDAVSKQFKQYLKKSKGARLIVITSGSLEINECRVDNKTIEYLNISIGDQKMFSRDPIITVLGFSLKVVGICSDGTVEVRPELLRGLCGDTDGDNLIVTNSRDVVDPMKFLPDILDYYDMKIGDMVGKCSGITNKDLLDSDKHKEWNRELTLEEVIFKMDIQIKNLGHTKSATQRCGYWAIIIGQFISENIVSLADKLEMSVEKAHQKYRFLLFKLQQSLTDAKHDEQDASLSLPFKLTDIHLKFNDSSEIPNFLNNKLTTEIDLGVVENEF